MLEQLAQPSLEQEPSRIDGFIGGGMCVKQFAARELDGFRLGNVSLEPAGQAPEGSAVRGSPEGSETRSTAWRSVKEPRQDGSTYL